MTSNQSAPGIVSRLRALFFKRISDKRKYTRVPLSVKVTNLSSGTFTYYHATNISIGGMFLKADEPLAINSTVKLQFSLPDQHDGNLEIAGSVVRIQKNSSPQTASGMGVKFEKLGARDLAIIQAFVDKKL